MSGKRSNKSLSNKIPADGFYNDQLLSCLPTAQSLHRRTSLKRYTLYHIYCHIQTELNNSKNKNSPNLIISTQQHCPQAPRSHLYDLHCQESTKHASPAVHPRYRLSMTVLKGSENMKVVPIQSCLQKIKLITKKKKMTGQ